jgi:hypothetical protein
MAADPVHDLIAVRRPFRENAQNVQLEEPLPDLDVPFVRQGLWLFSGKPASMISTRLFPLQDKTQVEGIFALDPFLPLKPVHLVDLFHERLLTRLLLVMQPFQVVDLLLDSLFTPLLLFFLQSFHLVKLIFGLSTLDLLIPLLPFHLDYLALQGFPALIPVRRTVHA